MKKINKFQFSLCVPLASQSEAELISRFDEAAAVHPDFIEWRRDAFPSVPFETEKNIIKGFRKKYPDIGLIYTFRKADEGGAGTWTDEERLTAISQVVKDELADYVDIEASNDSHFIETVTSLGRASETDIIFSFHDFDRTPSADAVENRLDMMDRRGIDVIKTAYTAYKADDVRRAAAAVSRYSEYTDKPVIFVSMGPCGAAVRALPELFGGSLTFAAVGQGTAPGQLTPEEIDAFRKTAAVESVRRKSNIALIGYMATGKSTVGKRLAEKAGMTFVDTDELVEKRAGKSISEIFSEDGEDVFREIESAVLRDVLKNKNQVIATGGGIVIRKENRSLLAENAFVVTLTADVDIIAKRVSENEDRPLLQEKNALMDKIRRMTKERAPYYQIGDMTLDTGIFSPEICAGEIISRLEKNEKND